LSDFYKIKQGRDSQVCRLAPNFTIVALETESLKYGLFGINQPASPKFAKPQLAKKFRLSRI